MSSCPYHQENLDDLKNCPYVPPAHDPSAAPHLKENYSNGFWIIGPEHGFMPSKAPLTRLPERFQFIQDFTDNMPVVKDDGTPGYLATPDAITEAVNNLPEFYDLVSQETDVFVWAALYRALTFMASAYLLEPAHQHQVQHDSYGKARTELPAKIARPLVFVADKLNVYPFLDYHYSYSLGNYTLRDPSQSTNFEWTNLKMACAFSGKSDENGFIMLHVDIVSHSPALLSSIWDFVNNRSVSSLRKNYEAMLVINRRRQDMWKASNYRRYNDFRVFIMGIKGNTEIFGPDGVVYKGCYEDKPQQYRGQSGSQDDIIPTEDIFTGLIHYYPDNILTRYLMDMRTYRPKEVREFFDDLQKCNFRLEMFAEMGVHALILLLAIVDQIYVFRNGHWVFVQRYILQNTGYGVATGGTPITSWLPNQIDACLRYQAIIIEKIEALTVPEASGCPATDDLPQLFKNLKEALPKKVELLARQVEELSHDNFDPFAVYELNKAVMGGSEADVVANA